MASTAGDAGAAGCAPAPLAAPASVPASAIATSFLMQFLLSTQGANVVPIDGGASMRPWPAAALFRRPAGSTTRRVACGLAVARPRPAARALLLCPGEG